MTTCHSQRGLIMPLSRHTVRIYPETSSHTTTGYTRSKSSQLAEPLWTDPGIKSGISARGLISMNKVQAGNQWSIILPTFSQERIKPPPCPLADDWTVITYPGVRNPRTQYHLFIICGEREGGGERERERENESCLLYTSPSPRDDY